MPAPVLELAPGGFDRWLAGKSSNFRRQMRRARRQLEGQGAVIAMAESAAEVRRGVAAFRSVLRHKWGGAAGEDVLAGWIDAMLEDAARELLVERRFRLWTIRVGERPVAAHVFLAAGGEVSYWLGGFDPHWAAQRPSLTTILACIEDAWQRGDRRLDLGGGAQAYKYRFASTEDTLEWTTLVPRGRHYWRARAALLPRQTYHAMAERIPVETRARIRDWLPG